MNPYETPKQASEAESEPASIEKMVLLGRPCDFCGSCNTGEDRLSRVAPSVIFVLFFGWVFLLGKAAFSKKTDLCRDCGQANVYKTTGSKIALVVLIVLAVVTVLRVLQEA